MKGNIKKHRYFYDSVVFIVKSLAATHVWHTIPFSITFRKDILHTNVRNHVTCVCRILTVLTTDCHDFGEGNAAYMYTLYFPHSPY